MVLVCQKVPKRKAKTNKKYKNKRKLKKGIDKSVGM
jgi:hypothetical protein